MGMATTGKKVFALSFPPLTGALIYILTEPKTTDVAICAVIWTLLWWFVFAVGFALDEFH